MDEDESDESEDEGPKKPKAVNPNNPNLIKKTVISDNPEEGLNRKQREVLEEQRKKEEYMKRHLAGETEQARQDLARLALIRKRREEDAKKREAEGRAPGMSAHGIPSDSDDSGSDESDDDEPKKPSAKVSTPALSEAQAKKKAAALETVPAATTGGEPAHLKPMDIKKMNGDALKEALRERGLDLQGQKKDLMTRLLNYEAAR